MTTPATPVRADALAARALDVMPGGASHDARQLLPYGLFAREACGPRKTGADGFSVIDLQCGNGALLLGHGHPEVLDAARKAIEAGLNFGAGSEIEILWAEAVRRLMPAAEQVRFTGSGNEACALAIAVGRATTGRDSVLVLRDHYFGWVAQALLPKTSARQFLASTSREKAVATLVEAEDVQQALEVLASGRVCGVIFEPTGGSFGKRPLSAQEARKLNTAAQASGSLCIVDETITGFRVTPGGAQQLHGLRPDLIILGKILAGGLPGGALAGRREPMRALDNRPGQGGGANKVSHMGTGNGNPVVAAVGVATLAAIRDGTLIARANRAAARLRTNLNNLFFEHGLDWAAYGEHSGLHLFLNPLGRSLERSAFEPANCPPAELRARSPELVNDLRVHLLRNGLDLNAWPGGLLSSAHDDATIEQATVSFASTLHAMKASGQLLTGWARP